jgi:hypothetical protein
MGTLLQIDESGEDGFIISSLTTIVRRLLCLEMITPQQIIALGTALYALERLPETTDDVFIVCEMSETEEYHGGFKLTKIWHFTITSTSIFVNSDGFEEGPCGGDSYHRFTWGVDSSGHHGFPDDDFNVWLQEVDELLNEDFELLIKNESVVKI